MGFLSKLIGGNLAEPIEAVGNAVDAVFTSDDERLTHEEVKARISQNPAKWMQMVNLAQAQHRTLFVAGARPFILWVCGFGLAFTFLINPILQWATGAPGPELPQDIMMELVLGVLGLSGLRSVEKIKGAAK